MTSMAIMLVWSITKKNSDYESFHPRENLCSSYDDIKAPDMEGSLENRRAPAR